MDAPVGQLLRQWRERRRHSQLALATAAGISTRHLSFVETGRARPSRGLILHLGERLELPLRERNRLLLAAGFAPAFAARDLGAPPMRPAREALQRLLAAHEPNPALVVDRHWNLLLANRVATLFLAGVAPALRAPPANVLRLSLHPDGLAPLIVNLAAWRAHILHRLDRLVALADDGTLRALREELAGYPAPCEGATAPDPGDDVAVPLRLRSPAGELALIGTLTVFGTPLDVTLAELALESFFPADADTADRLRTLAAMA